MEQNAQGQDGQRQQRFVATAKLSDGRIATADFYAADIFTAHQQASVALRQGLIDDGRKLYVAGEFNVKPADAKPDGDVEMIGPYKLAKPRVRVRKTTPAAAAAPTGDPAQTELATQQDAEQQSSSAAAPTTGSGPRRRTR